MNQAEYQSRKYIPELDGIRALSAFAVLTAHLHTGGWDWLSGGRGLTWFFLLSGYLITRLSLHEEELRERVSLPAFYIRRCLRIFPLYYVTLALYCLLIVGFGFNPEKYDALLRALPYYLTYLPEFPSVLGTGGSTVNLPFGHSWSLGIEEKFYLIWPTLAFGILAGRTAPRFIAAVSLNIVLLCASFFDIAGVGVLFYAYANIMIGCVLALVLHDRKGFAFLSDLAQSRWRYLVLIGFVAFHFGFEDTSDDAQAGALGTGIVRVLYVLVSPFVLAVILLGKGLLQQALSTSFLTFLGRISYGIYLFHRLCLNVAEKAIGPQFGSFEGFGEFVVASGLSVVVAYVAHVTIEKPCIALGRRWADRIRRPSLGPRTVPLAVPGTESSRAPRSDVSATPFEVASGSGNSASRKERFVPK